MRTFHLGDVLSVTTGHLLSPRGFDGLYDILNYMTGENLSTTHLPRAGRESRPFLLEQFPQLKDIDTSGVNEHTYKEWMIAQVARFGETLNVKPLPPGVHRSTTPQEELARIRGGDVSGTVLVRVGNPPNLSCN